MCENRRGGASIIHPATMATNDDLPIIEYGSQAEWSAWLEQNHERSRGVWVKIAKKSSGIPTVTHPEALEEALRFGWIDGQRRPFDETYFLQRFTPRTTRSRWSQVNVASAERLIQAGRMRPAGLRQIEAARTDGRWQAAYEPQSRASVPEDLQQALDANPEAKAFFETLRGQKRYAILYRVNEAKRPETRAKRIQTYVAMCAERRTLY
jgi:uncharacterized protein YdeI (YjbR/CyaY-like superfamily)